MAMELSQQFAKMQAQYKPDTAQVGTVLVQFENEPILSMKNEMYDMVLEVTGNGVGKHRREVDIVMVLDKREDMDNDDMEAMEGAVKEVITSVSQSDRVSIVTFGKKTRTRRTLQHMTRDTRKEIRKLVENLRADGTTSIGAGLQQALEEIDNRESTKRYAAIMLISNGVELDADDVDQISVNRFPIFTFELEHDESNSSSVLKDIARKSKGEYNMIDPKDPKFDVLIKCLDEFKCKPIKDVKLILKPLEGTVSRSETSHTKINHVCAGKYAVSPPDATGSRTVSLGNLDEKERRKVLVNLSLQSVTKQVHIDSLRTFCLFRDQKGNDIKTNPLVFRVKRYATPKVSQNHIKLVEIAKNELVYNESQSLKYGPYGSQKSENFRVVIEHDAKIKEVSIWHGYVVDAIEFTTQQPCGKKNTQMYGGTGGDTDEIVLKRGEFLTRISGVYGNYKYHKNQCLIGKLWIHTNLRSFGPYGKARGVEDKCSFSSPVTPHGPIVGFFGRRGTYLESIGIFMKKYF